jgi:hypothetical protein
MAGTNTVPSGEQYVDLTRTLALMAQLRMLDAIWTHQARVATTEEGSARAERVSSLTSVVDALDAGLENLADLSESLEPVFAQHADAMRREFAQLPEEQRTKLRGLVEQRGGDFAAAVLDATSRLRATVTSENSSIRTEFGKLSGGADSGGDFSSQVEADLALVAAGASALFGPEAFPVVEGIAHLGELAVSFWHWLTD